MWFISRFFADDIVEAETEPNWKRQSSKTSAIHHSPWSTRRICLMGADAGQPRRFAGLFSQPVLRIPRPNVPSEGFVFRFVLWESGFGHKPEEPLFLSSESVSQSFLQAWCKALADEFISVNGLKIDDEDRLKIAKAISTGAQRAALTLNRRAKGDYSLDSPFPVATRANEAQWISPPNRSLESLLEG